MAERSVTSHIEGQPSVPKKTLREFGRSAAGYVYSAYIGAQKELREKRRLPGESEPFKQAWETTQFIGGWLQRGSAEVLFEFASAVPEDQDIVELGSYVGRSTAFLALASPDGTVVHSVDHHVRKELDTETVLAMHMREIGVLDKVNIHKAYSAEAAGSYKGKPVGMLFVDADHTEAAVTADVCAWTEHLAPNATIVFDDIRMPGVARGVDRLVEVGVIPPLGSLIGKLGVVGPIESWPPRVQELA